MQRFLSIALALCVGLTLSLDANAKRFGVKDVTWLAPDGSEMTVEQWEDPNGVAWAC